MKRAAFGILALVSGCCFFSPSFKDPDRPGETVEDIPAALDRFVYGDLTKARAGEWVTYKERDGTTWTIKIASADELVAVEFTRGTTRLEQKIKPPDTVVESYWIKDKPHRQTLEQAPARVPQDREFDESPVQEGEAEIAGKKIAVKILTRSFADSEGMLHEERYEFSPQVPSLFTRTGDPRVDARIQGGLVRVITDERVVELVNFGP
jgi:hypothetical protein